MEKVRESGIGVNRPWPSEVSKIQNCQGVIEFGAFDYSGLVTLKQTIPSPFTRGFRGCC